MRRLPVVTSMFSAALLVMTLVSPASARPRDPDRLPPVAASQAREALQTAQELFQRPPASARRSPAASLEQGRSATGILRDLWRAQPRLRGSERATADRILARPTPGEGVYNYWFSLPAASKQERCSTNFCVHYTREGENRATDAQAARTVSALEYARKRLVADLGYRAPVGDTPAVSSPGNPDGRFDVFLGNLGSAGIYGYCTMDPGQVTAYCGLDNDFAEFPGTPLNALKATVAHEFFHAIQFAYDPNEDLWLMEGSSVWAEERVFDGVNDYVQYIRNDSVITRPGIPSDQDSIHNLRIYSAMLFFEHLTQTLGTVRMRQVWESAVGSTYSLQAVRRVVSRVSNWPAFINRFAVWNSRPAGVGYSERASYPSGRFYATRALGLRGTRTTSVSARIDHLASRAIRLRPARASTSGQRIRITINGPSTWRGAVAAVQRRWKSGRVTWNQVRLNAYGNAVIVQPFGRGRVSSVVVTLANASTTMRDCGSDAPVYYACGGYGVHNDPWKVTARVIR